MVVSSIWAGAGFSLFAGTLRERSSWLTPWLLVDSVLILLTTVFGSVGIGGLCYSGRYQVAATFAFVISFTFMVSVYMKLVVWSYYCELRERRHATQLPERV
ncbi:uncharacterized protein LOC126210619 [Schistocerca nitens]|nr:uncharacterized protein LOC126210619 [Schistocerca nitens]